jgi:hypothetical protein
MGKLVELVEQTLAEANSRSPLAEKIVAVLFGDKGSSGLRPGMMMKVFGALGKIMPQEDFQKNQIHMSTKYGDKIVKDMIQKEFEDNSHMFVKYTKGDQQPNLEEKVEEVKQIVRNAFNKYVRESVRNGKLDPETRVYDDNYYGWIWNISNYDEVKKINAKARPEIEKELKKVV